MTDLDLVARLAKEAGAEYILGPGDYPTDTYMAFKDESGPGDGFVFPSLARFAALVAEECAALCEMQDEDMRADACAATIRHRFVHSPQL